MPASTLTPFAAAAMQYARRGWLVLPLAARDKVPHPMLGSSGGFHRATSDHQQIAAWWHADPFANVGLVTGGDLGVVIDVDYLPHLDKLEHTLPETRTSITGGGGRHYFFALPEGVKISNRRGRLPEKELIGTKKVGIDVRGEATGYIVAPPSIHPDGGVYAWDGNRKLAQIPRWLLEVLTWEPPAAAPRPMPEGPRSQDHGHVIDRARAYLRAIPGAVSGQEGHKATFAAAQAMVRGFDLSEGEAFALLASEYNPRCVPPWSDRQLMHKVTSASAQGTMEIGSLRDKPGPERRARVIDLHAPREASVSSPPRWEGPPPDDDDAPDDGLPVAEPGDPPEMTPFVARFFASKTRAAAHWRGTGKSAGDTSPRGYDWTVACDVAKAGGSYDDIVSALLSRPDGHALREGMAYVRSTAERAAGSVAAKEKQQLEAVYLEVDAVTVQATRPPIYTLTIGPHEVSVSAAVLSSASKLKVAIMETTHSIPALPPARGGLFDQWINGLLTSAVVIEMPDDASTDTGEVEEVRHRLSAMPSGTGVDGLERGCVVEIDDVTSIVLLRPLFAAMRLSLPQITRPRLAQCLRSLGWESTREVVGDVQVRVWRGKR